MDLSKYEVQTERLTGIARRMFPGCVVRFGTEAKPFAMQWWISDQHDQQVLCAFPGLTDLSEIEEMSDEQIEAKIREVSIIKAADNYTVILEFSEETKPKPVRAIATSRRDVSSVAVWISLEQTRSLLALAYGGEQTITDEYMEQLRENHVIELHTPAQSHCIFAAKELVQFGFSPEHLKLTE